MDPVSPPTSISPLKQFLLGLPESSMLVRVVILPDFSVFPWFWTLPFAWNSLFSKFSRLNNLCSSHASLDATVSPANKYYGSSELFFFSWFFPQEVSSTFYDHLYSNKFKFMPRAQISPLMPSLTDPVAHLLSLLGYLKDHNPPVPIWIHNLLWVGQGFLEKQN